MKMHMIVRGGVAGLVATVPMSAVMLALQRLLPDREQYPLPPEEITTDLMERAHTGHPEEREQRWPMTLLTHFGFGTVIGSGLAVVSTRVDAAPGVIGVPYSLAVWTASYLGWIPAMKILTPATQHPARRNLLMLVAHVVWGVTAEMVIRRLTP